MTLAEHSRTDLALGAGPPPSPAATCQSVRFSVITGATRYHGELSAGGTLSIGHADDCDLHVPQANPIPPMTLSFDGVRVGIVIGGERASCGIGRQAHVYRTGDPMRDVWVVTAPPSDKSVFDVQGIDQITIGPHAGASLFVSDPSLDVALRRGPGGTWLTSVSSRGVWINNHLAARGHHTLRDGDHIGAGCYDIVLGSTELACDTGLIAGSRLPRLAASRRHLSGGYPDYRRSPRLIYRPPEEKITINTPPGDPEKQAGQLIKLIAPPAVMLTVTIAMALMGGHAFMVMATGATTLVTMVISVTTYVKDRKKAAAKKKEVEATYAEYLANKAADIHRALAAQRSGAHYHYPDIETLTRLGTTISDRVFEKTRLQFDFATYRLGLGVVDASIQLEYADKEHEKKGTDLSEAAFHLYDSSRRLARMPITTDLMHGPVGYVGPRHLVIEQLQLLVDQLAVFHSYHDLQFVLVFGEDEKPDWEWARWFRHASLQEVNVRGLVYDQRSRDLVLSSLHQILKARLNAAAEAGNKQTIFTPHYVVAIVDESLVLDHPIMELLSEDPTPLGCSVVFVQDTMSSLTDSVTTVIDVRDKNTGVLVLEQGEVKNTPFALDHFPAQYDKERLPRAVGALNHLQNLKSSIPDSVTFLELYGVERFEELDVVRWWGEHSPHKSLGVPLGLRGPDDVVKLDLHEKAHGPHGLVAGTTGSGKSEIIQSYILSLAVNFHPHDVAFLLIDYKGGGMANLFADLPHLLGTITNLDGAQAMRALVSINAELKRRQRVFSEHNVNHINQYQKLYKQGDAKEPMPHLFLISDEFAELKAEQPEFMNELVSTARIGRSLGIHLILATQKPSGVVNDQIWSNSKFKLALKVADKADSMEIIKTPDAAEITLPGRAYLQVGNNEIYELFQSAWSGADYEPDKRQASIEDRTIYAINPLGQYEILNEDLSGLEGADEVKQIPTELEAIVTGIHRLVDEAKIPSLPRPWLPPLPTKIYLPELHQLDPLAEWSKPKSPLTPVIGMVDVPSMQAQNTLAIDLSGDGHIAVYASPGYGKSTFLQTLAMDLARAHSPEHLNFYLLDFGTNGLLPLRGLPHVADTLGIEDREKARKFVGLIEAEIKNRKQLLSQFAVANLEMFERASGRTLPAIVVLLDSYEGFKDAPFDEALTGALHTIAREGASLGVHLVVTAGRQNAMRVTLSGNIKTQIVLKLNDDTEARAIVGRTTLVVDDLPGRGLIKLEAPEVFHTALPAEGEDMLAVIDAIQAETTRMAEAWQGDRPPAIPVIPETLAFEDFVSRADIPALLAQGTIPLGLDYEQVKPIGLSPARSKLMLLFGQDSEGAADLLKLVYQVARRGYRGKWFVFDDQYSCLRELRPTADGYAADLETTAELVKELAGTLATRQAAFREAQGGESPPSLPEFAQAMEPVLMLVSDPASIADRADAATKAALTSLGKEGPSYGIFLCCAMALAKAGKGYDDFSAVLKTAVAGVVAGKVNDQPVLKASNIGFREPALAPGDGYLIRDGVAIKIKTPTQP